MRALLAFSAAVVFAASANPAARVQHYESGAYTQRASWLRADSAPDAPRVALLPEGTALRIGRCGDRWCEARFRTLDGFVESARLGPASSAEPIDLGRGYTNVRGEWIPSPTWAVSGNPPEAATARCRDGAFSFSQSHRGTCSRHGGVRVWL